MDCDRSGRSLFIPFAKRVLRSFKMEDAGSLLLVLELDDEFDGDINDISFVSCFMRSNLTSMTGYFEKTFPRYLPYEF